ncbi:hypothetical protein D3OALGA1CA_4637 [Olavius algarvensis associated proteobacterium Delta 3]|nr:hypothetical protein D3OALGA1CA_4637 [Olavius algarvensis associated proteobacterium Delta 3]
MHKLLWISPILNHYKAKSLSRLNEEAALDVIVLQGRPDTHLGHSVSTEHGFKRYDVPATKKNFSLHPLTYITLLQIINRENPETVLMPLEKKNTTMILLLYILKGLLDFKLVTYNHPPISGNTKPEPGADLFPRFMFLLYDKVIFYTVEGMQRTVGSGLLPETKAAYANNTLDTRNIWKIHSFSVNTRDPKRLLFIGRLVPYRKVEDVVTYYTRLKALLPGLELVIIGDGPEAGKVKAIADSDPRVEWKGAVTDEAVIAQEMDRAHAVFMPGHSGLSIVHAFAYGKPYVTSATYPNHPPEVDYLLDGINGLLLKGPISHDVERIAAMLNDPEAYSRCCKAAYDKAKALAIDNWCAQILAAVTG